MSKKTRTKPDPIQQDMAAFERAALKLARYYDNTTVHGILNCVLHGWIQHGRFTEEYRALARQAQQDLAAAEAAEQRVAALRQTARDLNSPSGGVTSAVIR